MENFKKISIFVATMAIVFASCSNELDNVKPEIKIPEAAETIPLSDALEEMFAVFALLPSQEGNMLRSAASMRAEEFNVTTIYARQAGVSTRSGAGLRSASSQEDEDEPLLYVVNFEEGGFSI